MLTCGQWTVLDDRSVHGVPALWPAAPETPSNQAAKKQVGTIGRSDDLERSTRTVDQEAGVAHRQSRNRPLYATETPIALLPMHSFGQDRRSPDMLLRHSDRPRASTAGSRSLAKTVRQDSWSLGVSGAAGQTVATPRTARKSKQQTACSSERGTPRPATSSA